MSLVVATADLLGSVSRAAPRVAAPPWRAYGAAVLCGGALHGLAMGLWSGRALQVLYSGVKVPLLLALTTLLCAAPLAAFSSAFGLRRDLDRLAHGILAAQATGALVLASVSPLVLVAYAGGATYPGATIVNAIAFLTASLAGACTLVRHGRALVEDDRRHRAALLGFLALYPFVGIQLGWSLRPFIGDPTSATTFFRAGGFTNAYVDAWAAMWMALT